MEAGAQHCDTNKWRLYFYTGNMPVIAKRDFPEMFYYSSDLRSDVEQSW